MRTAGPGLAGSSSASAASSVLISLYFLPSSSMNLNFFSASCCLSPQVGWENLDLVEDRAGLISKLNMLQARANLCVWEKSLPFQPRECNNVEHMHVNIILNHGSYHWFSHSFWFSANKLSRCDTHLISACVNKLYMEVRHDVLTPFWFYWTIHVLFFFFFFSL